MITVPLEGLAQSSSAGTPTDLEGAIRHAAELLPSQGPITVFVHHNTLHALEDLPFDQAVAAGGERYRCHPFLPEDQYRDKLASGRIRVEDLEAVLADDLGYEADRLVASFGTRYALRLAMLQFPLRSAHGGVLRWLIGQSEALRRFSPEVPEATRQRMIADTRAWLLRALKDGGIRCRHAIDTVDSLVKNFGRRSVHSWSDATWEAFTLQYLWRVCHKGVHAAGKQTMHASLPIRHRDLLLAATGRDADQLVHDVLIRFTSAYVDQGFADWRMPTGQQGFYDAFLDLYGQRGSSPAWWMRGFAGELRRLRQQRVTAAESILESLEELGVAAGERDEFMADTLLALRGWAGMLWQLETAAPWTPRPAPPGTLIGFLAVRLILDRFAAAAVGRQSLDYSGPLSDLRSVARRQAAKPHAPTIDERAYVVFQLAQVRRWRPMDLQALSREQWQVLVDEIEVFTSLERRRLYHRAYERKYRNEALDAVLAHVRRTPQERGTATAARPAYQVACCIDEREESFRRALEEIDPQCETLGIAGFFGVAMYYRGIADAHYKPLCPVNVRPQHYVHEEPLFSQQTLSRRQAESRRRLGRMTHTIHLGSRGIIGGFITGLLGSLAAFPLVARVLLPRFTARLRHAFGRIIVPPMTDLQIERLTKEATSDEPRGYAVDEMADIVEGGLRAMGLVGRLSQLVIVCGHGSSSLNNPHEAAHDCGACGGGRGGPNARAFAKMANDRRVRAAVRRRGLSIGDDTVFVGGYHNTCDDSVTWYDLDEIPYSHRTPFERARTAIDQARQLNAHERCRRFESADLALSPAAALRHVENRAEDLSQTRPEYGHATNALCFVGRRQWSRGLFLDRRAFLTSYDPGQDDSESSVLNRLLQAVIPVCSGINLEYYFSFVDPTGYGCGTKLPHNITSLVGVMDGAASDLRTGLPWQMVEIHEPVRLLFVIETTAAAMLAIIESNPSIARLVRGHWVQLAILDTAMPAIQLYQDGEFVPYEPESLELPAVARSVDWYQGKRCHLGFASVTSALVGCAAQTQRLQTVQEAVSST